SSSFCSSTSPRRTRPPPAREKEAPTILKSLRRGACRRAAPTCGRLSPSKPRRLGCRLRPHSGRPARRHPLLTQLDFSTTHVYRCTQAFTRNKDRLRRRTACVLIGHV